MENNNAELYDKLMRFQWLLQRHRMLSRMEHGPFSDTTRGQGRVLAVLKLQPEISTKDLSYLLGIRIPSLNELLSKMEKGGYIERKPSDADKRVMLIHLTEKGRETKQMNSDHNDIFGCLSGDEQAVFGEYLDRVADSLEERVPAVPDDEETERRMDIVREQMGNEQFERIMAMRGGYGCQGRRGRWEHNSHGDHGHGDHCCGRGEHGHGGHGEHGRSEHHGGHGCGRGDHGHAEHRCDHRDHSHDNHAHGEHCCGRGDHGRMKHGFEGRGHGTHGCGHGGMRNPPSPEFC